jgi:hypothetical protein
MSRDPIRFADLAEGASSDDELLRALIRAERTELPTDAKMTELATRLEPIVANPGPKPLASASRWLVVAAVAGLFITGAVALRSGSSPEDLRAPAISERAASVPAPETLAITATSLPAPPAPVISVDALPSVNALPRTRPVASSAAAPTCTDEIELVDRADAALRDGDAKNALARTREHAERCSNGAFVQERERIAIEALAHLGRTDEVRTRARAFESRFPSSPHLRRIRSLVE